MLSISQMMSLFSFRLSDTKMHQLDQLCVINSLSIIKPLTQPNNTIELKHDNTLQK